MSIFSPVGTQEVLNKCLLNGRVLPPQFKDGPINKVISFARSHFLQNILVGLALLRSGGFEPAMNAHIHGISWATHVSPVLNLREIYSGYVRA